MDSQYLEPTRVIDSDNPAILDFAIRHCPMGGSPGDKAIALYYAVRDGFRYDPYSLDLSENGLRASTTLAKGHGWCVSKAILLAACCRAVGVPARLGFADVRNHLTTERLKALMETDVFYYHGYAAIYLNGQWLKATPAFNIELCDRAGVKPLEFDGTGDSIYHEFDKTGQRHMEYLNYRGEYADLPLDDMLATLSEAYPNLFAIPRAPESFDEELDRERNQNLLTP